ncbi:Fish-egg lectin [Acipenser ruthenus]|uniref:Fish-egg lectin n=1 Tax=Acipenser ruthenus TaxID=7906 RepID=A0A662YMQ9_ACIRT|nr:Fish-egg lectin [Acipenser ruthenus]
MVETRGSMCLSQRQPDSSDELPAKVSGTQPDSSDELPAKLSGTQPDSSDELPAKVSGTQPDSSDELPAKVSGTQPDSSDELPAKVSLTQPDSSDELPAKVSLMQLDSSDELPAKVSLTQLDNELREQPSSGAEAKPDKAGAEIDAGGDEFVAGVNLNDNICLNVHSTDPIPWNLLPGALKYYSCGPYNCWEVNSGDQIYVMKGVTPSSCMGSNTWQNIPGALSMIEVSTDSSVYGVNSGGDVFRR